MVPEGLSVGRERLLSIKEASIFFFFDKHNINSRWMRPSIGR